MTFVALSILDWPTGAAARELPVALLAVAPRAAIAPQDHLAWLDARGLDAAAVAGRACGALMALGVGATAGIAVVPCVAAIAAREQERREQERKREGGADAGESPSHLLSCSRLSSLSACVAFLAPLPLDVLTADFRLLALFHGVGVLRCGQLARLTRESVEVRFGNAGLALWRLARADDPRPIFSNRPRELPNASLDWSEFSTTDLEQLVFVLHSLLKTVCDALMTTGLGARALTLTLTLENRRTLVETVGAARVTAQRTTWLRLMRRALERITLPDRVTGIAVQVDAATAPAMQQGDLFDPGFASAHAAESAVGQIQDLQSDAVVVARHSEHLLLERQVKWSDGEVSHEEKAAGHGPAQGAMSHEPKQHAMGHEPLMAGSARIPDPSRRARHRGSWPMAACSAAVHPVLLPTPREITVLTQVRRGFDIPLRYTDNGTDVVLTECLGPHCRSGERWGDAFTREYFQGVRSDGVVTLLYRDVVREQWYLSGWWD